MKKSLFIVGSCLLLAGCSKPDPKALAFEAEFVGWRESGGPQSFGLGMSSLIMRDLSPTEVLHYIADKKSGFTIMGSLTRLRLLEDQLCTRVYAAPAISKDVMHIRPEPDQEVIIVILKTKHRPDVWHWRRFPLDFIRNETKKNGA